MTQLSPLQRRINFYNYYFAKMASDIFEFRVHVRNALQKWLRTNQKKIKKMLLPNSNRKYGNTFCCLLFFYFSFF